MAWESLLKVRRFLTDDQVKIANALTNAAAMGQPVDLSDYNTPEGRQKISKFIKKIERISDESFDKQFEQVNWNLEDKEDYLTMLREVQEQRPPKQEIDKPYIREKIEQFLEGNHTELLNMIETSKNKAIITLIQKWTKPMMMF